MIVIFYLLLRSEPGTWANELLFNLPFMISVNSQCTHPRLFGIKNVDLKLRKWVFVKEGIIK